MAKKVCLYGILSAVCIVLSFVEHLVGLDFIAPGVKIGLANSIALLLLAFGDVKGAFAVNIVRVLLSGLLFSSPFALIYSLSGAIASLTVMTYISRLHSVSLYGTSILGAVIHNLAQLVCATVFLGSSVWYYSSILLISAIICGTLTATVSTLVFKKFKNIKTDL